MGQDVFLLVLAALTVAAGIALLVMVARRRRERRQEAAFEAVAAEADLVANAETEPTNPRRTIDDYAIPVSFDSSPRTHDDEDDIGKICPACGARYGSHHRVCERDNSELAALN